MGGHGIRGDLVYLFAEIILFFPLKQKQVKEGMRKMSTSKDKKAKALAQEQKSKRQTRTIVIIFAALVVVLLAAALLINSNLLRRNGTAVKINGESFSPVDYNYYYSNAYTNYANQIYSYFPDNPEAYLPDANAPFAGQLYDETTGETWADVFREMAIESMTDTAVKCADGRANGFALSDEQQQAIDDQVARLRTSVEQSGAFRSFDEYLKSRYGAGMNEECFLDVLTRARYAECYDESVREGFTYSDEALEACYRENRDSFDTFAFRYFYISASNFDSLEQAEEAARAYADAADSEQAFIDAARDYDSETFADDDATLRHYQGDILGSVYGDWLRSADRKSGDVTIATMGTSGVYVVYFISRDANAYPMVNAYAVEFDAAGDGDEAARAEMRKRAEEILTQWEADADHTAENFVNYVTAYSDSTSVENGYLANVYRYQYTGEMNDWLFDEARKPGDVDLVSYDENRCFILFYDGTGDDYCDYQAENKLRTADYDAWTERLTQDVTVKRTWLLSLANK